MLQMTCAFVKSVLPKRGGAPLHLVGGRQNSFIYLKMISEEICPLHISTQRVHSKVCLACGW